ncbi:MAG: type II secretion system protein M [Deltaproteobacteria bacterium]|nr:type II secretion system protein M [Deltaproteobacteria bacterium]
MNLRLNPREKWLVGLGAVCLVLLLGWAFGVQPALTEMDRLDRSLAKHAQDLAQLETMVKEWQEIKAQSQVLAGRMTVRRADFSLADFMEELVAATGLKDYLGAMRPLPNEEAAGGMTRVAIEMRFNKAPLKGVIEFLHRVEYSDQSLAIPRFTAAVDPKGLDVSLRVDALVKRKP